MKLIYVGTAAWNIPKDHADLFEEHGSHLERYSRRLNGVEINTSFYRDHKPETYSRWAETVPENFRFSVKLSKHFTHETRLRETGRLNEVLSGIMELGEKLGMILVQLPPSLAFEPSTAERFLSSLRKNYGGLVAWEPRHKTWSTDQAIATMKAYEIGRVLADPEPCTLRQSDLEKLNRGVAYYRLHGSPEIYKSDYSSEFILNISESIKSTAQKADEVWCIFDNTTFGHATANAVELAELLELAENKKATLSSGFSYETNSSRYQ